MYRRPVTCELTGVKEIIDGEVQKLIEELQNGSRNALLLPDASKELVPLISYIPFRYEIVESAQPGIAQGGS
jgi:hypothetical protein